MLNFKKYGLSSNIKHKIQSVSTHEKQMQLEMWANAQRDGRPAEHRWCPMFNAANFG